MIKSTTKKLIKKQNQKKNLPQKSEEGFENFTINKIKFF